VILPHRPVKEDELTDPDYEEVFTRAEITKRTKIQAKFLEEMENDYLISLCEFHMMTGNIIRWLKLEILS